MRGKTIAVSVVSFLLGTFVSYGLLSSDIEERKEIGKKLIETTQTYINKTDYMRVYNRIDVKTDNLESFVAILEYGTPIDVMIESNIKRLREDLPNLEKLIDKIEEPEDKKRATELVERTNKSLKDIEFYYSKK